MPKKVLQIKCGGDWHTLGRCVEEGARKHVEMTAAGMRALEANPIEGAEPEGKMLTVSASYVRNHADCCRVIPEAEAEAVEPRDEGDESEDATPEKSAKKKAKAKKKGKKAKKADGDAGNE